MRFLNKGFSCIRMIFGLLMVVIGLGSASAFAVGGGAVTFIEIQKQGVNGVTGLNGISDIAVSADGKFVYSASYAASAVSVFQRDPVTGMLTYVSSVVNGSGGVSGISTAFSIASSRDNKSIYVASPAGYVTAFSRNETTGALTFVNTISSGQNGMTVSGFVSVTVSPDGKSVYGIGGSSVHGLAVFSRDLTTGAITFAGQYVDNQNGNYLGQGFSATSSPIKNIAVSTDGAFLYVTSTLDNAVSLYSRDLNTGLLTLVAAYIDGANGVDGIQGASSLTLSPNGKNLYVSGQGESSVAIFDINQTTGVLTYVNKITQGVNGVTSLAAARSLGISPDGRYVYSSAITSNAITAFSRDLTTGLLTVDTVVVDGTGGVDGLTSASGMSTDPLNRHLYVAGQGDNALSVFSLPIPAVALATTQQSTTVSGPVVVLDSQLELYDSDSINLASASIAITAGFINTDLLSITTQAGIVASYNAGTGVLSLTGVAPLADYKASLRTLSYTAGADASLSSGQSSSRSISITVSDEDSNTSAAAVTTVSVLQTISYTVTFVDWDTNVLKTEQVASGGAATAPTQPTRAGYTFSSWDVSFSNVTAALTVTAQYTVNSYAVTFDLAGGTRTSGGALQQTIAYGQAATAPVFTAPAGKTFSAWSTSFANVTGVTTVTAQYTLNNYSVTAAISGNGTVTPASQQVAYGSTGSFTVSLTNSGDVVNVNSNCGATLSGGQLVTSAIEEDCAISLVVYSAVVIERENTNAATVNSASRFTLSGGTGEQLLSAAKVLRSGAETQLETNESSTLVTRQSDGSYLFSASRTGRYTFDYVDTTSGQHVTTSFDVLPYLAFTSSQQPAQQNTASMLRVWLSDEPIEYPVHVNFSAVGASVAAEQFEINAGDNRQASYSASATAATATVSLVKESLVGALLGTPAQHTLAVQQALPPLSLNVTATQNSQQTYVVSNSAGVVTLNAVQLNDSESSTYTWTGNGLVLTSAGASASFDPATLAAGLYKLSVSALTSSGRAGRYDLALRVITSCSVADCGNSVSGIPVSLNPVAQTPNRLPICPNVNTGSRVGNCQVAGAESLYAEAPSQYSLTLGELSGEQSWGSGQFGMALNDNSLADNGYSRVGTLVNFDVVGLENPGEAVPVAIPLPAGISIPANAIWRKFINNQWQDFVVDDANFIHSAARDALGQCPGVSSDVWSQGLTEGHGCVRLTIADGGPNDDDGLANSVIRDPGVLATQEPVVPPVPPVTPVTPVKNTHVKSAGGSIDELGLLALGLFALVRSRKIWAALTVLLSPAAMAGNTYLGLDGLLVHSSASNKAVSENLNETGLSGSADLENTWRGGGRIYAGYKLDDKVALEVGWLDMGHVTTHFSDVPATASKNQLASVLPHSGEGVEVAIHWTVCDITDRIKPGIRAGVWQMSYENRYFDGVAVVREKKNDRVPFIGLDLVMPITETWATKIGASSYFTENDNIGTVNLGLTYSF